MTGLDLLKELLDTKTRTIIEEENVLRKKQDITSLKIKISTQLQNDYHKVILCQDEEIYKLIEEKIIEINFEDYKSMKFVIANEQFFSPDIPQYQIALEQANSFISSLTKTNVEQYGERINSLEEILSSIKNISNNIASNKPILDLNFILNLLASSQINKQERIKIISDLINYNNKVFKQIELQTLISNNKKVEEQLSETLKVHLTQPKETPKYKLSEEEQKLYNYAIDIINNYNPSSYGYVQPIEETLREVDTVIIELSANPNDKDYLKYLQNELRILAEAIANYQKDSQSRLSFLESEINQEKPTSKKQYEEGERVILFFRKDETSKFLIEEDIERQNLDNQSYNDISQLLKKVSEIPKTDWDLANNNAFKSYIRYNKHNGKKNKDDIVILKDDDKEYCLFRLKANGKTKPRLFAIEINICSENRQKLNLPEDKHIILIIGEKQVTKHSNESEDYSEVISEIINNKDSIIKYIQLFENPNTPEEILYKILNDSSDLYNYFRDNSNVLG